MVNAYARELHTVTPEMIAEVAADFRLATSASAPEEPVDINGISAENNESLLRSLFRLLRTMDSTQSLEEKPIPSADGRRV
jgi:hypothetical protein